MKKSIYLIAIAMGISFASCGDKNSSSAASTSGQETASSEEVMDVTPEDDGQVAEEPEGPSPEELALAEKDAAFNAMTGKLRELCNTTHSPEYFTLDITGNGIPELFVLTGDFEAEKEFKCFAYQNGSLKKILDGDGAHSGFYVGSNYVVQSWGHMGSMECNKLVYSNGKVIRKTMWSYEDEDGGDCPEVREPGANFTSASDLSALLRDFNK